MNKYQIGQELFYIKTPSGKRQELRSFVVSLIKQNHHGYRYGESQPGVPAIWECDLFLTAEEAIENSCAWLRGLLK